MFGGMLLGDIAADGTRSAEKVKVDFSVGIPGISLDANLELNAKLDYLMGIGLGISLADGVFLDTGGINTDGEELALDVQASLTPGSTASGTLGLAGSRSCSQEGNSVDIVEKAKNMH